MILVTGATGLVGGHLLWHLLQTNSRVVAIKRKTSNLTPLRSIFNFYTNDPDQFLQKIEWKIADILDRESLDFVLEGVTSVYHCAAVVALGSGADQMIQTNVEGTANIVGASVRAKVESFCFVSSIAACGHTVDKTLITESTPWVQSNRSPYAVSKYLSEQEVWKGAQQGLNVVVVNPGVILGFSGTETGSAQLFSQVRKGLIFYTLGGSGYVDVRDVVKIMMLLVNNHVYNERFILVAENSSNKDILSWMADGFMKKRPFICIGKSLLISVGCIGEMFGKLFSFKPLIDCKMARTASSREYYSNYKVCNALNYKFLSIRDSIMETCSYMNKL